MNGHEFLCASDDVAEQMEWAQIALGEGARGASLHDRRPGLHAGCGDTRPPVAASFAREAEAIGAGLCTHCRYNSGRSGSGPDLYLEPGPG